MKKKPLITSLFLFFAFFLLNISSAVMAASMSTYSTYPPFMSATVKPNVLVLLDTSTSMLKYAYTGGYNSSTTYNGYFDDTADYSYDSTNKYFYEDSSGSWDGNFLNWVTMRRMDLAKKVLTGGRTATAADSSTVLLGQPYPDGCGWSGGFETSKSYSGHTYDSVRVVDATGPYFQVDGSGQYYIRVKVSSSPTGIVHDMANSVRFGLEIYSPTYLSSSHDADEGGKVLVPCDEGDSSHIATMVSTINSQDMLSDPAGADTWTQMAESLYSAAGYFAQESTVSASTGPMYASGDYTVNAEAAGDPHYFGASIGTVWCAKNFVIIISDGEALHDGALPASLQGSVGETCGSECYLDDVAHWVHTNDIRTSSFGSDLSGTQSITLYTVSTFGGGEDILKSAAKFGGFIDSNDNDLPDLASEWDEDSDGDPDNYFAADTATELEAALSSALYDILNRVASGSAISVLSTSEVGEGAVYQAYFYGKNIDDNGKEITWPGYLLGLFIDEYGNIREDSNTNDTLDMTTDKIIVYYFDESENRTRVKKYLDSDGDGEADGSATIIEIEDIESLWDAGKVLAQTTPSSRTIYTWIDNDTTGTIGTVDSGEFASSLFATTNKTTLRPFLGATTDTEAEKMIGYVRGTDQTGYRSREIDVDGTDRTWKLGDIIYSTPAVVGKPAESYDLIYGDTSYATFKNTYKDRRNVIYVGANDGMLHAFNGGFYNTSTHQFSAGTGKSLGEELWAYIPYNLLPHLQWLTDTSYSHVYYVDLKPKVIDAKIFANDATHPGGWGTVLVCGMRFGGGQISLTDDFGSGSSTTRTFRSAYFALDITNPESTPDLLWEFTHANLAYTTSYPAVVYTDPSSTPGTWWIAFGSGPTDFDGTSTQLGRTFVVNLKTGARPNNSPIGTNWGGSNYSFMGDPISVDVDISDAQCSSGSCSYRPDVFYIGCSQGTLWRVSCIGGTWAGTHTSLLALGNTKPITAAPSVSQDDDGRLWLYFGTGRFFNETDKTTTVTQSLVGVKEPYDWSDCDSDSDTDLTIYCGSCLTAVTVSSSNLLNVTDYAVYENGWVDEDDDGAADTTFSAMVTDIFQSSAADTHYDGWILNITSGERCITKPTILGGMATFSTYKPIADVCTYEGNSYLYALYYKTGTAFADDIIGSDTETLDTGSGTETLECFKRRVSLGRGVSASPSLHIGSQEGAKVILQTSTGQILQIQESNLPESYKSCPVAGTWLQN